MFKKLLLLLSLSVTPAVAVSAQSTNGSSTEYDFIAPDSETFRLGDYEVTELDYYSLNDNTTNYSVIKVIIPHIVFDQLSNYEIVYIAIPNFRYHSNRDLSMSIDLYDNEGDFFDTAFSSFSVIPLSESMLSNLGYTVVDIPPLTYPPNPYNLFDPAIWDYNYLSYEIRLTFSVPTYYTTEFPFFMYNITLFTKLGNYYDGYVDGYDYGLDDGYDYGLDDGYYDGYYDGIQEGLSTAEGTWLGNLIFGTVGSVVGFIFAISDFEVLGVSIMSIITLFVAIGVIMLFIKLIKGTNYIWLIIVKLIQLVVVAELIKLPVWL